MNGGNLKGIKGPASPLVSIVVPTHNRLKLLGETVTSILSQTFTDFEIIIVENDPVDDNYGFLKKINDKRIRYFLNPADRTSVGIVASNRNMGIRESRGEYIAFCDDDDLWVPEKLGSQVRFMEANHDTGLCFGYVEAFGQTFFEGHLHFSKKECDSVNGFESLFLGNKIATLTVMVRKRCLDEVGLFDENPELKALEDYDLWLRVARRFKIVCIPMVLGRYRIHPEGISRNEVLENMKLLKILEKFRKNGWVSGQLAGRVESNIDRLIANAMLSSGDRSYRGWYLRSARFALNKKTVLGLGLCLLPTGLASGVFTLLKGLKIQSFHRVG